ncbi:MAG: hypothetical protein JST92_25980, partial [Deltaproteobacteria bacterium]|nr:hypothetical protein [Deltaproteobacteria bacterium]
MSRALPCALLCALPCVLVACGGTSTQSGPCVPGQDTSWVQGDAFGTLSQYCMVSLVNGDIVPKDGVVPYDLNTPLFSDRAVKKRTIFVPKGASITYDAALAFDLPTGSIVTKSFGFRDDLRKANPIVTWVETRVMLRRADGWHGQSYVWNAEQTEAVYTPGGAVRALSWVDENGDAEGTTSYLV